MLEVPENKIGIGENPKNFRKVNVIYIYLLYGSGKNFSINWLSVGGGEEAGGERVYKKCCVLWNLKPEKGLRERKKNGKRLFRKWSYWDQGKKKLIFWRHTLTIVSFSYSTMSREWTPLFTLKNENKKANCPWIFKHVEKNHFLHNNQQTLNWKVLSSANSYQILAECDNEYV